MSILRRDGSQENIPFYSSLSGVSPIRNVATITLTGIRVSLMLAMMDRRVDYDSFPSVTVHFAA